MIAVHFATADAARLLVMLLLSANVALAAAVVRHIGAIAGMIMPGFRRGRQRRMARAFGVCALAFGLWQIVGIALLQGHVGERMLWEVWAAAAISTLGIGGQVMLLHELMSEQGRRDR